MLSRFFNSSVFIAFRLSLPIIIAQETLAVTPVDYVTQISVGPYLGTEESASDLSVCHFFSTRPIYGLQMDLIPGDATFTNQGIELIGEFSGSMITNWETLASGILRVVIISGDGTPLPEGEVFKVKNPNGPSPTMSISNVIVSGRHGETENVILAPFVSIEPFIFGSQTLVDSVHQVNVISVAHNGSASLSTLEVNGESLGETWAPFKFTWSPTTAGPARMVAWVRDNSGRLGRSPALDIHVPGGAFADYASWAASYWSTRDLELEGIGGFFSDPDGDGLTNYFEFATNGNPLLTNSQDVGPKMVITEDSDGNSRLSMEVILRRDHLDGQQIYSLVSNNLPVSNSSSIADLFEREDINADYARCIYRDPEPMGSSSSRFLQLYVIPQP